MNVFDFLILGAIVLCLVLTLRGRKKARENGSSCCSGCSGACPGCTGNTQQEKNRPSA